MQKSQPLSDDLQSEIIDACRIAARMCQAGDHTKFDRVFTDAKDDWDRRGRSLRRKRGEVAKGRGDNGYSTTDEIGHQCWQAIELALQPMVLHRHVLALDITDFAEALAERSSKTRNWQPAVDETDNRHRWLLRARHERPCSRAAQCGYQFTPSNMDCQPPTGVMQLEGTISHLDVLRCGISNRPMSVEGHKPRRRSGPGVGLCPLYLPSRRNFLHRSERRQAPQGDICSAAKRYRYSITSSASCWSCQGTSRPSAFAVLRLMTSSYLVGACTGRSAGFAPRKMRST